MFKQESSLNNISITFNIAKAVAILSVIIAHTPFKSDNFILNAFLFRMGSMGVIVFIVISGYFYNPQKHMNLLKFLNSKVFTLIIPWFFCSGLLFFYTKLVMKQKISIVNFLNFIFGNGSHLYYLTILIVCYIFFFYPILKKQYFICYIAIILNIASLVLTSFGVLDTFIKNIGLTNYLNLFNWIGYFSLGILLQRIQFENILCFLRKRILLLLSVWLILFLFSLKFDVASSVYFSKFAIPLQLISTALIFVLSSFNFMNKKLIIMVSEYSFSIYLVHFFVIPIVYKLMGFALAFRLCMPLITLSICVCLLYIGKRIVQKLKMEKIYKTLLGLR